MGDSRHWRTVDDFWFPPGLAAASLETHRAMFQRWFGGDANGSLAPFRPVLRAARRGELESWLATPRGRLSLIILLDQFPRGLFAGTAEAYAFDPIALRVAEEGLRNGQYRALVRPWEKAFFLMPLAHTEGRDHRQRLARVVAMAATLARHAPAALQPLYAFSAGQACGHLEVIARFGRFPHRNAILGRASTAEEERYLRANAFVQQQRPPKTH
jgi:uncharacterized protein (DUF924 family)